MFIAQIGHQVTNVRKIGGISIFSLKTFKVSSPLLGLETGSSTVSSHATSDIILSNRPQVCNVSVKLIHSLPIIIICDYLLVPVCKCHRYVAILFCRFLHMSNFSPGYRLPGACMYVHVHSKMTVPTCCSSAKNWGLGLVPQKKKVVTRGCSN